jgi:hypothetical protein
MERPENIFSKRIKQAHLVMSETEANAFGRLIATI